MAGTIVVDRIESDSSYTSTINVASKVNFASGVQLGGADFSMSGMRNRIHNGAMLIDQRRVDTTPITVSVDSTYGLDRFSGFRGGSTNNYTFQQSSVAPTGFSKSLLITMGTGTSTGATDYAAFAQRIEGLNVFDFNLGSSSSAAFTLSFWIRCSVTGTFGVAFRNQGATSTWAATYTINQANTWEYKTITVAAGAINSGTWTTDTSTGIGVYWDLGVGSTYSATAGTLSNGANYFGVSGTTKLSQTSGATMYITGVQLEKGTVATNFEMRNISEEMQLCQRYYQTGRFFIYPSMYTNVTGGSSGTPTAANVYANEITLGIPMRSAGGTITPCRFDKTVIANGTYVSRLHNESDYTGLVNSSPYLRWTDPNTIMIYLTTSNGWYTIPIYFTASAEL